MKTKIVWVITPRKEGKNVSLKEVHRVRAEIDKILPKINKLGYKLAFHSIEME